MINVTQADIDILGQQIKECEIKLELLNESFLPIDILQGGLISGSFSVESDSDIRRTASFVFHVRNKSYLVNQSSKIWFNKHIILYLGIKSLRTQEFQYYQIGLFEYSEYSFQYDISTNSLTVKVLDLMSKLVNTPLYGTETYKITAGTNIRSAMLSVVTQLGGISKYLIGDVGSELGTGINNISEQNYNTVPYDLSFSSSDNVYSIITKLRDLYSGWESFCSNDTFICQQIPTGENESIILDWETIEEKRLLISEERNGSLDKVKNITQVFGKQITADRYTETCTVNGAEYDATFTDLTVLESGTIYAVKLPSVNLVNSTLKINALGTYPIMDASGVVIPNGTINGYSAFKFYNNQMIYLGDYQVKALAVHVSNIPDSTKQQYYKDKFNTANIAYVINPDSPFTVEKIGERIDVKSGSDFENIYAQDLALQRAKYENWKTTRLQDTLSLEFQLVPWLDVNKLITYKSKVTGSVDAYIIKSISITLLDGKMKLECIKYYSLYPDIV